MGALPRPHPEARRFWRRARHRGRPARRRGIPPQLRLAVFSLESSELYPDGSLALEKHFWQHLKTTAQPADLVGVPFAFSARYFRSDAGCSDHVHPIFVLEMVSRPSFLQDLDKSGGPGVRNAFLKVEGSAYLVPLQSCNRQLHDRIAHSSS